MTLRSIPVDLQQLSVFLCTSLPEARTDPQTGEARVDRATGQPLYLVGILVKVTGERRAYVLDIQVPGEPSGLTEGQPVVIEDLEAIPWERDGLSGVVYRAAAIRAQTQATSLTSTSPADHATRSKPRAAQGRSHE